MLPNESFKEADMHLVLITHTIVFSKTDSVWPLLVYGPNLKLQKRKRKYRNQLAESVHTTSYLSISTVFTVILDMVSLSGNSGDF